MLTYCEKIEQGITFLVGDEAHHLVKVLRCRTGDAVKLFDGKGLTATGTISKIIKDRVELAVKDIEVHKPKQAGRVIIAASVAKGERYDWLVGKCTELGVDRICPVLFERTVKQAGGHSVERYNKLALAAAKQCGRIFLPAIDQPMSLADCLRKLKDDYENACLLFGSMSGEAAGILDKAQGARDYAAFIGPEGGMTSQEEDLLISSGVIGVRLTDTILRIETAAVAFASILCVLANSRDSKPA